MAKLEIYNDITSQEEKAFLKAGRGADAVCFSDVKDFINSMDEGDENIDIHLHCRGGSCIEGWAIYDALRTSGKKITAVIDGECSSMASVILLAAPKESRFAQKNATLLIHNPYVPFYELWGETLTAADMEKALAKVRAQCSMLLSDQQKVLNLYVERTGQDGETLQSIMDENTPMDMERAKELGFISEIIEPNTDKNNINDKKGIMKEVTIEESIFKRMLKRLGISKVEDFKVVNMTVSAVDGKEVTIDREEGEPQIGDTASPDGEFVMEDGSTIVVSNGTISDIKKCEPDDEPKKDPEDDSEDDDKNASTSQDSTEELNAQIESLSSEINELKDKNSALNTEIEQLKKSAITDQDRELLNTVAKLGGKDWVDRVTKLSSNFRPDTKDFAHNATESQASIGQEYLAAKRAQRKRA